MGTTFNGRGNRCEWRRREPLGGGGGEGGGGGGISPQKIFKYESLKTPFPVLSSQ